MADNETSTGKIVFISLLTLVGVLIIFNWDALKSKLQQWFGATPESEKSGYDKCVESHKSLADGASCTNCIPDGSAMANYNGIIKNGVCERIVLVEQNAIQGYKLQVTKPSGAFVYTRNPDGSIVASQGGATIPTGTTLVSDTLITSPAPYYRVVGGWVDGNDVALIARVAIRR